MALLIVAVVATLVIATIVGVIENSASKNALSLLAKSTDAYQRNDLKSALELANDGLQLARKLNRNKAVLVSGISRQVSILQIERRNVDEAVKSFNECVEYANRLPKSEQIKAFSSIYETRERLVRLINLEYEEEEINDAMGRILSLNLDAVFHPVSASSVRL